MSRNAEGEFEMVLGNKQLLSLFFLVVVLFAVFFSLGYMVGRSVSPTPTLAAQPPSSPLPSSTAAPSPLPAAPSESAPARSAEPLPAPTETQPAAEPVAAVSTAPAAEPAAPRKEAPQPPSSPAAVVAREMHLQLAAVRVRDDAEVMVQNLKKKGYPVLLNMDTRDGWFRVLVGPFASEKVAREMKTMLEHDGYKSILKKP
jgi:DedD protein